MITERQTCFINSVMLGLVCSRCILLLFMLKLQPNRRTITKELSKELHEKAAPFIKWLKEADEESGDEEEEEEDDDDVEVSDF